MNKFNLEKLPELARHTELKNDMESAWELLQTEQYRAAANELRQALEYIIDCYVFAANVEEENIPAGVSMYNKIEFLKSGDWISFAQADAFHAIRMRCNAGVHRNTGSKGKQMTPADIRYSYELLVQELEVFFAVFPEGLHCEEDEKPKRDILSKNWAKKLEEDDRIKEEGKAVVEREEKEPEEKEENKKEDSFSEIRGEENKGEHKHPFLENSSGEITEKAFLEMMEDLLKRESL